MFNIAAYSHYLPMYLSVNEFTIVFTQMQYFLVRDSYGDTFKRDLSGLIADYCHKYFVLFEGLWGIVSQGLGEVSIGIYKKLFVFVSSSLHVELDTALGRDL